MIKVLLIAPCKTNSNTVNWGCPPLGIHRLAGYIRSECEYVSEVKVFDPAIDGIPSDDDLKGYYYIGFSPLDETLAEDIKLINRASIANPDAILIVGGVEATLNYQTILEKTKVEWIVTGYGEQAIVDIINETSGDIPGTIRRIFAKPTSESELELYFDNLSFTDMNYPAYWEETAKLYDYDNSDNIKTVRLISSTHCNRGCAFCSVTQWQKYSSGGIHKPAMLSADYLIKLITRIRKEIPETRNIYFCEDDACQDFNRIKKICEWNHGSDLRFLMQTHLTRATDELIDILAYGNTYHLTLGIENASMKILKSFNKSQPINRVPHVIDKCLSTGIEPYLLIILFAPEATIEDLFINIKTLNEWIDLGANVSIEPYCMPYRGAPLYETLHEFEYDVVDLGNNLKLKRALRILPDDLNVRNVMMKFRSQWDAYKNEHAVKHQYKGNTGRLMLKLLEEIIARCGYGGIK